MSSDLLDMDGYCMYMDEYCMCQKAAKGFQAKLVVGG
jgi:hypothetical protein